MGEQLAGGLHDIVVTLRFVLALLGASFGAAPEVQGLLLLVAMQQWLAPRG